MEKTPLGILREYWKYDAFRPMQEEIIRAVLEGRDVLALLPTGGGKSICFQVPALMKEGLCLVVSPLIALMKDQVRNLRRKQVTAFAIYSGMSRKDVVATLKLCAAGNCKFLYVSPERLETDLFKEYLPALNVNLIAVDEAHCVSQWGYDFRPPYLRIAALRDELPGIPVLALTASATAEIQMDICDKLHFKEAKIFRDSYLRAQLSFAVRKTDSVFNKVIDIVQKVPGPAIVYCRNRRRTKEIADLLEMHGIPAAHYHAGLPAAERSGKQEAWMKNERRVIVCTNAFGMGIDKPDVRLVIHADLPDCLENYYQEAGRAGRDGKKAYAVLLYNDRMTDDLADLHKIQFPPLPVIREVYRGIVNYLQVPLGTVNTYYDFDLPDFLKKFRFDRKPASAAMKVLAQEDYLSFSEQVFIPSMVLFLAEKEELYRFEQENPDLEPLIKIMLRTYSGIFDHPVPVHEKVVAGLLKRMPEETVRDLQRLHAYRILEYIPQKDNPQLFFSQPRRKAGDIRIDQQAYAFRKEQFLKRVKGMLGYLKAETCRSSLIARYFGEEDLAPCGICDNCLSAKSRPMSREQFENIHQQVTSAVATNTIGANELIDHFSGINREQLREVIDYLQSENKLTVDAQGRVRINNN
jgi:ATP-dependent DNA helicase RecQ